MTTYYYKVTEFITSFNEGEPNYDNDEDFIGESLLESRRAAINYFIQQVSAIENKGQFFNKPIEKYNEYLQKGKHAAYSIRLVLIEVSNGEEYEHIILGEDEKTIRVGQLSEAAIFKEIGIDINEENELIRQSGLF